MASKRLQSCVGDLRVLFVVLALFMWFSGSRRYDANGSVTQRIDDVKQATRDHANYVEAILVIILAVIHTANISLKTARAESKLMRCFLKFDAAFASSHSKSPSVIRALARSMERQHLCTGID
jgi:hypothetical protein